MSNSKNPGSREILDKSLELTKMLLAFGRIDRVVKHDDKKTWESDTDHTVMLGVMACAFAKEFAPDLERGKIAEFALVHDLVEVYAGDTMSFRIATEDQKKEKQQREHAAFLRIRQEYGAVFPWIPDTIEQYETLTTPEAQFVKFFDKVLPKLTHILNDGVVVYDLKHTKETTVAFHADQLRSIMEGYGKKHPEVGTWYLSVTRHLVEKLFPDA